MRARPAAAPSKLVATSGPAAGEEFALSGDEAVIGRSSENAVSIPDTSVSRKHVLLRKTPEGWAASDMGSGNGTLVNGATISEETLLKAGDVITLGDTELRFEDGGGAAAPRRAPVRRGGGGEPAAPVNTSGRTRAVVRTSRRSGAEIADAGAKRKKLIVRVGVLLVVILAGGVGLSVVKKRDAERMANKNAANAAQLAELQKLKQEANNLARAGKWADAKAKFLEVQALNPEWDVEVIGPLIAAADKEIPNQQHMQEALDAVAKGQIGVAAKALALVTKDTTQFKQREQVLVALEKRIGERINEGRELLGKPSDLAMNEALKALTEDILAARPENRDALAFKATADENIRRIKNPVKVAVEPARPWIAVQQLFQNGDQTGAFSTAEACAGKFPQCRTLKSQIMDFGDRVKKAESASPSELLALIDLDKKIGDGKQSPLTRNIGRKAADAFYLKASSAKATGNWQAAIDHARKATLCDPGHPASTALLQDARSQAKDVYLRGYQMKDTETDGAIKLFKDVLSMTPKDDEYHEKAKARLEELAK